MTNLRNLTILIFCGLLFSCGTEKKEEALENQAPERLVGTWQLKQRIYTEGSSEPELVMPSDTMIYNKNLTETHFTWIQYDKKNDVLLGTGGGTYNYDGSSYVEHIEFFMPLEAGILGQAINFTADFKDGEWYHTGFIKEIEFDPELAQMVIVDSNKIDEIWQKVEKTADSDNLVGTWKLVELRNAPNEPAFSYPDFVNYLKLITPSHFIWIQYNDEGDQVSGVGSGTYTYNGDNDYREQIQMRYPTGNPTVGGEYIFKIEIGDDGLWNHYCTSVEKNGLSTDSIYVDEKWAKFESI